MQTKIRRGVSDNNIQYFPLPDKQEEVITMLPAPDISLYCIV